MHHNFLSPGGALVKPGDVVIDIDCSRGTYADDPVPIMRQLRVL